MTPVSDKQCTMVGSSCTFSEGIAEGLFIVHYFTVRTDRGCVMSYRLRKTMIPFRGCMHTLICTDDLLLTFLFVYCLEGVQFQF